MERRKIIAYSYSRLVIISALVGIGSAVIAFLLKQFTESAEEAIHKTLAGTSAILLLVAPVAGLSIIYFLRRYLFQNRKNKGITEIYKTLDQRKDHLPLFKIPSHCLNGFLTIVSGGSTGIEVSTVVAAATVGNTAYKREFSAKMYKRELVCAGVTSGVAVLFGSPLTGWLFAMEVIARKMRAPLVVACSISAIVAGIFIHFQQKQELPEQFAVTEWHIRALPYFLVLSLLGGLLSAYFTVLVIRIKALFAKLPDNLLRVSTGAILAGSLIFLLPYLYGDSYHGLYETLKKVAGNQPVSLIVPAFFILLKPLAAALTLGAGGDGGVFGPSIVSGAFLGLLFAMVCNNYLGAELIPLNFALVGAAATLSSSILAPFTALILVCNLVPNGYALFIPLLIGAFVSRLFFKQLLPYNVYTYDLYMSGKTA